MRWPWSKKPEPEPVKPDPYVSLRYSAMREAINQIWLEEFSSYDTRVIIMTGRCSPPSMTLVNNRDNKWLAGVMWVDDRVQRVRLEPYPKETE